ncbi:MAG: beta-lactamase family protein [bacterium]|nr:beta-lactamase family protein [bacterium]
MRIAPATVASVRSTGLAAGLLATGLTAQSTPCHDFTAITGAMTALTASITPNASLQVQRDGELLLRSFYGSHDGSTVLPIASSTKWLSGAVIMSLVDDGLLDLDAPVSGYLPAFSGLAGTMTVRQMFSHTAGTVGSHWVLSANNLTLAQAVNVLANVPLRTTPGTDFYYGGVSMHIAGRVAEVVSGQSWANLFRDRIALPLRMTSTDYLGALGSPTNPRIAAGARSTLGDLSKFVAMLQNRGRAGTVQVLSPAAADALLQDQTGGVPITSAPNGVPGLGYAIGAWVERKNATGRSLEVSSQGAFGCTPWLDLERGTTGVFFVRDLIARTDPFSDQVRSACRPALRYRGVTCFGSASPHCAGFVLASTNAIPIAGDPSFLLLAQNAPANGIGAVTIGLDRASPPIPALGVDLHVQPTTAVTALVATDALGVAQHGAPLTFAPAGLELFAQFAFLPAAACPGPAPITTTAGLALTLE